MTWQAWTISARPYQRTQSSVVASVPCIPGGIALHHARHHHDKGTAAADPTAAFTVEEKDLRPFASPMPDPEVSKRHATAAISRRLGESIRRGHARV
jgi:hypothetical protein